MYCNQCSSVILLLFLCLFYIMQDILLSKINVKKGKIIHFCEIVFTSFRAF
ncbi:hypothetical protein H238_0218 [Klebsiella pneumoniae UHKPC179]|nr:hypothetical protein H237_0240 [Klebsiella pneumoniae UHKPC57]EPO92369.1 hypothetical protein H238_0218 [Klebsiella pneumoniae UHKPC179]